MVSPVQTPSPTQAQPRFFADPAIDKLAAAMAQLTSEVWVLNERFAALQAIADEKGVITKEELAAFQPSGEHDRAIGADRGAFIRRIFGPLTAV